jgi:hypothetical protein
MMTHACNLNIGRQDNYEFEASLGYTARPYLQNKTTKDILYEGMNVMKKNS